MNYLFVGRNGMFETLIAAWHYLYKSCDIEGAGELWGNLNEEKKKTAVWVDKDKKGNNIYVLGVTNYVLVPGICREIEKVARAGRSQLEIVPVQVKGENVTALLVLLSRIPIIGIIFNNWAKQWTFLRRQTIIASTKEMLDRLEYSHQKQPVPKPWH